MAALRLALVCSLLAGVASCFRSKIKKQRIASQAASRENIPSAVPAEAFAKDAEVGAAETLSDRFVLAEQEWFSGWQTTTFAQAFARTFFLMCTAEIFDRTWFMTLICSLNHGAWISFFASFSALTIHSVVAIVFGESMGNLLPRWEMDLISALALGIFTAVYAWEYWRAEAGQDAVQSRLEEANEGVPASSGRNARDGGSKAAGTDSVSSEHQTTSLDIFAAIFASIFVAGWGDRQQFVQITLAASSPGFAVLLGSLVALFFLCLSAVVLGTLVKGRQVNERLLSICCCLSFGIMTVLALSNARRNYLEAHNLGG